MAYNLNNSPLTIVSSGLMAQYKILSTETVAALIDYSGNGNNATGTTGIAPTIIPITGGLTFSGIGGVDVPAALNAAKTIMTFVSFQSMPGGTAFLSNTAPVPIIGGSDVSHYQSYGIIDNQSGSGGTAVYAQNSTNDFSLTGRQGFTGSGVLSVLFGTAPTADLFYVGTKNVVDQTGTPAGSFGLQTDGNYVIGLYPGGSSYYFYGQIYYMLFYNRLLSAAEIAQNVSFMEAEMAARGVPTTLSNTGSTATSNVIVTEGDSITAGFGTSPWPPLVVLDQSYGTAIDNALAGLTLTVMNNSVPFTDNYFLNSQGIQNAITVWAGTNDMFQGGVIPTICFQRFVNYCRQLKQSGWTVFASTVISRNATVNLDFDTEDKDVFNALLRQNWRECADVLVDEGATLLGADGASANTDLFLLDTTHPTNFGVSNIVTPLWQMAINRYYGNHDFSSAIVYNSPATAPVATTAGTFTLGSGFPGANYITLTFVSTPANMQVGRMVTVVGCTPVEYNGTFRIASRTSTQITYWTPPSITILADISVQGTAVSPQQQDADQYVVLDFGAGDFTLMTSVGYTGQRIHIKNINAATSVIVPFLFETIDGNSALTIAAGATIVLESIFAGEITAGNNWITIVDYPIVAGSDTDIQVNSGGVLYADSGFTYNHTDGTVAIAGQTTIGGNTIATPFITFAAPTVVPTPSGGSTTYTYTVNALCNNIVIAQSAVGTTTTGPATLDGSDYNTITWLAVPGADHYTVCDTGVPVQSAPVTGLTLNDIGAFTAVSIPSQGGFLYNPYGILIGDPLPDIALVDTPNALYNSLTAVSQLTVALDGAAHSSGVNDTVNAGIAVSIFDTNTTGGLAGIIVGVEAVNDTTTAVGFWSDVALTNAPDASVPNGIANYSYVIAGFNNGDATEISCLNTNISNTGTGTITLANGIHIYQGSNAGTITELDGILIDDQTVAGGTVTNAYALHIEEQTTATVGSGNWAIKVECGTASSAHSGADGVVEFDGPIIGNLAVAPTSSSAAGAPGQIAWDGTYIYVCTSTNTWVRTTVPMSTF